MAWYVIVCVLEVTGRFLGAFSAVAMLLILVPLNPEARRERISRRLAEFQAIER
jgi:hypothetical protein